MNLKQAMELPVQEEKLKVPIWMASDDMVTVARILQEAGVDSKKAVKLTKAITATLFEHGWVKYYKKVPIETEIIRAGKYSDNVITQLQAILERERASLKEFLRANLENIAKKRAIDIQQEELRKGDHERL